MRRFALFTILNFALAACGGTGGQPSTAASAADGDTGETVTVTGVDYAFSGVPSSVSAGTTFAFTNDGTEPHEMIIYRINDDVTLSIDEILAMPEEEAMELVTEVGGTSAPPGEQAADTITVDEPGTYGVVCFVPIGSTEEDIATDAPPHFTAGMFAMFEVTD